MNPNNHPEDQASIEAMHQQYVSKLDALNDDLMNFQDDAYALGRSRGLKEGQQMRDELSGDTLPPGVVELSLRGQPGSGKSTLMVILGEHLQKVLDEHAAKRGWHPAKVLYAFKETTAHGIAHACVNHARVVLLREVD